MATEGPAIAYYRACEGRWQAKLEIKIIDLPALQRSGMALHRRLQLRLLSAWSRRFGHLGMETSVAFDPNGEVVHTTLVRWLGLPVQRSVEFFTLATDGATIRIRGGMTGSARAREDGMSVDYELEWLGVAVRQRTLRSPDRVTVHMEGPGFSGVQELERRRE
jgi:hypothetical protein